MTFKEKKLYHQVHPAKLATDISVSIITLYLFWEHKFFIALTLHLLPPIIGSLLIIKFCNLEKIKNSALGNYISRYMTPSYEAIRLLGDIVTILGAWYHLPWLMILGLLIVLVAWFNGKIKNYFTIDRKSSNDNN